MPPARPPAPRAQKANNYEITHPAKLDALVGELVARHGSARRAAQATQIDLATLSRLRSGDLRSITHKTFEALQRAMWDPRQMEMLDEALLPPSARATLVDYRGWLRRSRDHLDASKFALDEQLYFLWSKDGRPIRTDSPYWDWEGAVERLPEQLAVGRWDEPSRVEAQRALYERYGEVPPPRGADDPVYVPRWPSFKHFDGSRLVARLRQIPAVVEAVQEFAATMIHRGHLDTVDGEAFWSIYEREFPAGDEQPWSQFNHLRGLRVFFAWRRALDPLLAGREAGFVERLWEELDDRDLTDFVRAGLRRESILLDRAPDAMRARETQGRGADALELHCPLWDRDELKARPANDDGVLGTDPHGAPR